METKKLEGLVEALKVYKKEWGLKETGKRDKYETYKKSLITKVGLILKGRETEEKYLGDIEAYCEQIYKLTGQDLLNKYAKEKKEGEGKSGSPLLP